MKGIYKISFPNGKCYIGQSINLNRRLAEYKNWKRTTKGQTALYRAFCKYDFNETMFEIIEKFEDTTQQKLNELEILYIEKYNSLVPNGYNIQKGGNNKSGYIQIKRILELINYDDLEQPIINKKTNKEYSNVIEWVTTEHINPESIYNLYYLRGSFCFKNLQEIKPYYGEWYPKDITLQDISEGKGFYYVSLPIFENNDTKDIQLQDENTIRIDNLEKTVESQKKLIEKLLKDREKEKTEFIMK